MAHHVYNTQGFILDSAPRGEANKLYTVFTRELGLIRATAQGVRLQKSKLKSSLQDFSHSEISVVRGKDVWRITNAKVISNLYAAYSIREDLIVVIAQVFSLLKRLIHGEEKNELLYDVIDQAFYFLSTSSDLFSPPEVKLFEYSLVIKILNNLGYIGDNQHVQQITSGDWSRELLAILVPIQHKILLEINRSLRETQL